MTAATVDLLYPHRSGEGSHLSADDNAGFESGRVYEWKGYMLDSVTSIISAGVPKGEALTKWAARTAAEYAIANIDTLRDMPFDEAEKLIKAAPFKKRDDAAELGNNVHDYAEALVLGLPLPELSDVGQTKAALFRRWLDEYKPDFQAAECWCYNLGRRYAGRFDAIARIEGIGLTLIDYKTGSSIHPEVGLQLAALRNAEFVGLSDGTEVEMPRVDACAVLHIMLRKFNFKRVSAADREFNAFLYAQQVAEWRKTADADVIGDHIAKPPKYAPRPNAPVCVASMLD